MVFVIVHVLGTIFISIKQIGESVSDTYLSFNSNYKNAISYINSKNFHGKTFLSDEYVGIILPAFAPVISYVGHHPLTYQFRQKKEVIKEFYSGAMDSVQARDFLSANGIAYVFFGADERKYGFDVGVYPFLENVFTSYPVSIYRFR